MLPLSANANRHNKDSIIWRLFQAGGLCTSGTVLGFATSTVDLLVGGRQQGVEKKIVILLRIQGSVSPLLYIKFSRKDVKKENLPTYVGGRCWVCPANPRTDLEVQLWVLDEGFHTLGFSLASTWLWGLRSTKRPLGKATAPLNPKSQIQWFWPERFRNQTGD